MVSFLSYLFVLKRCTRSRLTLAATLMSCSSTKSDRCEDNNWNECQASRLCRWSSGNGCVDNVSSLHCSVSFDSYILSCLMPRYQSRAVEVLVAVERAGR